MTWRRQAFIYMPYNFGIPYILPYLALNNSRFEASPLYATAVSLGAYLT